MQENIRYILVWSGWLRLTHWVIAAGVLFQITSAWAITHQNADILFWRDWHIISGQAVLIALMLRAVMLFFPGSGHWSSLLPNRADRNSIVQMFKFYLTFARFPLPNWYAHNPLWKPLYLLFFVLLASCLLTGIFQDAPYRVAGYALLELHKMLAQIITLFVVTHVVAVFLHDLKGKGAFTSAIINGYRYFHISDQEAGKTRSTPKDSSIYISVESIKKQSDKDSE